MMDLARERKKKNLTQHSLSLIAGVSRSHIANIERGSAVPSIPTAKKLSHALGTNWQEFFE